MNDISKNENQKQYNKIHEKFKDPLSDKDLIKIMNDFGKSDDDFLEEFSENWNATKNTRIDSLIETIETFYKSLDSQFKGEEIKVFDLNSARFINFKPI